MSGVILTHIVRFRDTDPDRDSWLKWPGRYGGIIPATMIESSFPTTEDHWTSGSAGCRITL